MAPWTNRHPPMPAKKPQRRTLSKQIVPDPSVPEGTLEDWEPCGKLTVVPRVPGTGSIDKVKRGKYTYLRSRVWTENAKGVRVRREVYAKTESALSKKIKALQDAPTETDAKKLLLSDYLEHRFLPGMKLKVRPTTYDGYDQAVRLHIVPEIGKVKLAALTPSNVVAWLKDLDAKPRAKKRAFMVIEAIAVLCS